MAMLRQDLPQKQQHRSMQSSTLAALPSAVPGGACDPCLSPVAPADCRHMAKTQCCAPMGCSWIAELNRTLGLRFEMTKGAGWGNYWPLVRSLHLLAATLGRRLLLHRGESLRALPLPVHQFAHGGTVPWMFDSAKEAETHIARAHVLHEVDLRSPEAHLRSLAVRLLRSAVIARQQHVWLNVSWYVQLVLAKGAVRGNPKFYLPGCANEQYTNLLAACIGRLATTPIRGSTLALAHDELRRRMPADGDYIGVHVRTLASDLKPASNWSSALARQSWNASATLVMLAWDTGVNVNEYAEALRSVCAMGSLYIASDSGAVVKLFEQLCPRARIFSSGVRGSAHPWIEAASLSPPVSPSTSTEEGSTDATTAAGVLQQISHSRPLARLDAPLLDWLLLSEARACGRWGHDSSFQSTAVERGRFCSGKMIGLLPKPWARRRRVHTYTLWTQLRRVQRCHDELSAPSALRGAARCKGPQGARYLTALKLFEASFVGTPCEGRRTLVACAQLLHAGLLA
jgi:hypothetical protein